MIFRMLYEIFYIYIHSYINNKDDNHNYWIYNDNFVNGNWIT